MIGFQSLATARFQPVFPDLAQDWTATYTVPATYQVGRPYLVEPFMNAQVCWDSEYYLSIAIGGYDDPKVPHLTQFGTTTWQNGMLLDGKPFTGTSLSLNYAFFPFYPWVMWVFAQPLKLIGLNLIATTTLAGVIVSALGALLAMLALYDLTYDIARRGWRHAGGLLPVDLPDRLFPGAGLHGGPVRRGWRSPAWPCCGAGNGFRPPCWEPAATLTRAVGVALVIPMALTWFRTGDWLDIDLEWRQIYYWWKESWQALFLAARKIVRAIFGIHQAG